MKFTIPDDDVARVMGALTHSSMSKHHPHCHTYKVGGGNGCNCHVQKAKDGLDVMKKALRAEGYDFSYSSTTISKVAKAA